MAQKRSQRYEYFEVVDRYDIKGETLIERGRVMNISDSGILYKGQEDLKVGDHYMFKFEVGGNNFFVEGVVARTACHLVDKKALAGVQLSMTAAQKEKLLMGIERLNIKRVL